MIWWMLAFGLPVAAAILKLLTRGPAQVAGRGWRAVAIGGHLAALAPTLLLTLWAPDDVVEIPFLLGHASFQLDVVARAPTLVTVLLYAAALTAIARRRTDRSGELAAFLLLCFVGNVGVYTAADVVTFYLAFSMMSYSAVGLVLVNRDAAARRAARVYLVLVVLSEIGVLAGLLLVAGAGTTDLAGAPAAVAGAPHGGLIVVLLIIGFGIKAGLVPLHVWLPLAHPAAPPAASAVLSGAMVKAGLIGWIRFLPLGEGVYPAAGTVLVVAGVIGAFGAVIAGIQQDNPKTVLAYSTVGQLGYLAIVIGVALAEPQLADACVTAAIIYAVHHGLAKGAAFIGVSVWRHHAHGRRAILVAAGMLLAAGAIVGAPLSSGAIGKYASKTALDGVTVAGFDLILLLPWVATGSTLLLVRVAVLLWRSQVDRHADLADPELLSWGVLIVMSVSVPWLVAETWVPLTATPGLDPVTLWDATWPMLAGLLIAAGLWPLRRRISALPKIPAGDLVVVAEEVSRRAVATLRRMPAGPRRDRWGLVEKTAPRLDRAERRVAGWGFGLGALIVLTVLIVLIGGR